MRFEFLPVSLAWSAFGRKNGVRDRAEFLARMRKYRRDDAGRDPVIGCIVLTEPFFFAEAAWIDAPPIALDEQRPERWAEIRARLRQGGFRVAVTGAYRKRCAVTGEKTLPVLEAAHIRPYAEHGPNDVRNGLLLRSDLHRLFDAGYLTIDSDHRVVVSRRIREEFENGREYDRVDGQRIVNLPRRGERPAPSFLAWHDEHVFEAAGS